MKNGTLKNVFFYYTRINEPTNKYQSVDKEYKTDIVVDKATLAEFSKEYPKKKHKMVMTDEFEEKYKAPAPFPEQPIQYVIKFNRDEVRKDGTPIPEENRPTVLLEDKSGVRYDVTYKYNVGNGSQGDIDFFVLEHPEYGDFPKLSGIVVKTLVLHEATSRPVVKELTDDVDLSHMMVGSLDADAAPVTKASSAPTTTKKAATPPVSDDDLPF